MAIASNGPNGFHRGRIGNVVYYVLNGQNVSRRIGEYPDPNTEKQQAARLKTKMCSAFLQHVNDFIEIGFGREALNTPKNSFNIAVAYNKPNMFNGTFPNLEIGYDLLILSKGPLTPAQNPKVIQTEAGLSFSWDADPKMPFPMNTDQVMLLAYFPKVKKSYYTLFGTNRSSGTALLQIPESLKDKYMETYITFASADGKTVADSTYTGSFNKP
ncbi:DUF6266 family protein [Pedobacter nyackensis]|uniref:DUF6266 family protein n=1 Tax=Pedobacter nyackensis TaxID=475255 RepID=UPI00292E53A9|nr:DUF6266 family protein [Pedobacter nyackensis]